MLLSSSYGVREVNQVKRLTGPGLSGGPEPQISVMITGGPWPTRYDGGGAGQNPGNLSLPSVGWQSLMLLLGSPRLSVTCLHYLGEFGEDQIYEAHQQGQEALKALLCGGPRGACSEEVPVTRAEL